MRATGPFDLKWLKAYICNPFCWYNQTGSVHRYNSGCIFRGCVWGGCMIVFCHLLQIFIQGTLGSCFHCWCAVYGVCKWSGALCPLDHIGLLLSSVRRLIWKHKTSQLHVRYMLSSVCLRLSQFCQLSFIQYIGCASSAFPIPCGDRKNV